MMCRRGAARLLDEDGSGSVLVVGLVCAVLFLALGLVAVASISVAQTRAGAAADAGALAAADAASGFATGEPCALASAVVAASGARLERCDLRGLDVTVATSVVIGPIRARATALAGPPRADAG